MSSNSQNMSVEDRLVEHIKSDTVMRAVADDDLLSELAKRAIEEAFFKPVKEVDRYGHTQIKQESKAVMAADAIANGIAAKAVAELWGNAEMKTAVLQAVSEALPQVVLLSMLKQVDNFGQDLRMVTEANIVGQLQERLNAAGVLNL